MTAHHNGLFEDEELVPNHMLNFEYRTTYLNQELLIWLHRNVDGWTPRVLETKTGFVVALRF